MKEKKELTLTNALVSIILLYIAFTMIFGTTFSLIMSLISRFLPNMLNIILAVAISILMMYFAWKLSVLITFKNKECSGLEIKKITRGLVIFLIVMTIISGGYDIYSAKVHIEEQYSNTFLEDKDVQSAFTPEELQARAEQNNKDAAESKKQSYLIIVTENILSLIINLLIFSLVPKKMLEKYDGVVEIEKNINKE
mgnify:CR=1 FL=1